MLRFSSWPTTLVQVANIDGGGDINTREYHVVSDWLVFNVLLVGGIVRFGLLRVIGRESRLSVAA